MNYKPLFLDKLKECFDRLPEYSVGEILYSMLTQLNKSGKEINKASLMEIDDEDFYISIGKALKSEIE